MGFSADIFSRQDQTAATVYHIMQGYGLTTAHRITDAVVKESIVEEANTGAFCGIRLKLCIPCNANADSVAKCKEDLQRMGFQTRREEKQDHACLYAEQFSKEPLKPKEYADFVLIVSRRAEEEYYSTILPRQIQHRLDAIKSKFATVYPEPTEFTVRGNAHDLVIETITPNSAIWKHTLRDVFDDNSELRSSLTKTRHIHMGPNCVASPPWNIVAVLNKILNEQQLPDLHLVTPLELLKAQRNTFAIKK